MNPLTLRDIADSTGGTIIAGPESTSADRVCTDSRAIPRGCVFVAIKGDRFDGHDFLEDARAQGASVAIVDREIDAPLDGLAVIQVNDTRRALGRLAHTVRRSITRSRVIAIGGSNGKTSTKNTLHAVLSTALRGSASPRSFNNDIGVPATLFPVAADDDYVILEIGTNHPGEIEHLSRMAEPDIAVITSIGEEHLEFFGTLDGVRHENAAIVAGLRDGGTLVINGDDSELVRLFSKHGGKVIRFGFHASNDLIAEAVHITLDGTTFDVDGKHYHVPSIGRHFASNALAVIAIGRLMGLSDDQIRGGLAKAEPSDMRMQKHVIGKITVINDAYNANPTSMRAAITTLQDIDWPGRKVAILGEMKELGVHAIEAHNSIAEVIASTHVHTLTVGQAWKTARPHLPRAPYFDDASDLTIGDHLQPGDLVLIKGSRSMRLERIADTLAARQI